MSRVIVFDEESGEPLTIVDIPPNLLRQVERGMKYVNMPVPPSWRSIFERPDVSSLKSYRFEVVRLRVEPIMRGRERMCWHAFPDDSELALKLRATFLPGQVGEVQHREEVAFFRGALSGVLRD